ncbi:MAG: trimethylamine methyltransferase family protein [Desulfobacterium sp.]
MTRFFYISFDDDQLAWDELMSLEYGGQFLTTPHTFKHCRNVEAPINFTRQDRAGWASSGSRDLHQRVREYLGEIMKDAAPLALPDETRKELSEIVKMADDKMC